jgi:GTPase Era involved in 16S rRNA processing
MSFFKSDVVRAEIAEINELQEDIYKNVFKFPTMTKEEKLEHVKILEKLLDKQKVLYTRLSLSDDPEAIQMKERITESASMMGLPSNVDMNVIFNNMSSMLDVMKQQIDKTGSDL